jgi:hypothetical protein
MVLRNRIDKIGRENYDSIFLLNSVDCTKICQESFGAEVEFLNWSVYTKHKQPNCVVWPKMGSHMQKIIIFLWKQTTYMGTWGRFHPLVAQISLDR